jgi:leader peptidase (prepilin peptidase)/N-methyltransferase
MIVFSILYGAIFGFISKKIINWISINNFTLNDKNVILELFSVALCLWSFYSLELIVAIPFSLFSICLFAISYVDYKTFQIPLIFIILCLFCTIANIIFKNILFSAALLGIFIGAIIPLLILGIMWIITKRQGMGYGDIQLGFVIGAMLGPMRMAITLFFASLLSLFAWVAVSIFKGFNRDRAMPMAPFYTVAMTFVYMGSFYYPDFFYLLIIQ